MLAPAAVAGRLLELAPRATAYRVGFSGGRDSHVLLHALAAARDSLPSPLTALHVDHGMHPDAPRWAEHCRAVCAALDVPLTVRRTVVESGGGYGPEAAARTARYAVYREEVAAGECLVLAHHRDDQAETVLLRLMRGAGADGLAGMPVSRPLGGAVLVRPLLGFGGEDLAAYAAAHGLEWVDDPSNADEGLDRAFLRRRVLPLLSSRWPDAGARLAAAADLLAAAADAEAERAASDLAAVTLEIQTEISNVRDLRPSVEGLVALPAPRRRAAFRYWLRRNGVRPPDRRRLEAGLAMLLSAGEDRSPELVWPEGRVRRYRDRLHFLPPGEEESPPAAGPWTWDLNGGLEIGGVGTLYPEPRPEPGLDPALRGRPLTVCLRPAAAAADGHRLKRIFQSCGVPPWRRDRIPLLYRGDLLIGVAGCWIRREYRAAPGLRLRWTGESEAPPVTKNTTMNN